MVVGHQDADRLFCFSHKSARILSNHDSLGGVVPVCSLWRVPNDDYVSSDRPGRERKSGLAAIRGNEWVAGIAQGINVVKVLVADVRVEHQVKLMDFTKWLEKRVVSQFEIEVTTVMFGRRGNAQLGN
jgi:hypothetical protein